MTPPVATEHTSSASPRPAFVRSRPSWQIILVLGYSGALVSVSQTIGLPLLPIIPGEFGVTAGEASWVATAALLAGAVANPVMGRLGDMYGKRRMILVCVTALFLGSLLGAVSTSLLTLVIARAMQGIGIGALPLGISVAKDELPPDRVNGGIALVGATMGVGAGLGLPMAGVILHFWHWHALFWVCAALAVGAFVAVIKLLPESPVRSSGQFDLLGAVWLSVILISVLLPISKAATWGWLGPMPLALFTIAALGFVGWVRYERRPARPLVDIDVMRTKPIMLVNSAGFLLGGAMFANFAITIAQLQLTDEVGHGFGVSVLGAGLALLPGAIVMMAMSPVSARITDAYGARTSLLIGSTIVGVGFATRPLALASLGALIVSSSIVNAGVGIAYGSMPAIVMSNVPISGTASANAVSSLLRAAGAAIASAVVAAIFGSFTLVLGDDVVPSAGAFHFAYLLAAALAFGSAALAWLLPRRSPLGTPMPSGTVRPVGADA